MKIKKDDRIKSYENSAPISHRHESSPPQEYNELKVIPLKKRINVNPGSSPEQRSGIEDINYQYSHGKAPMIEKRDR
jgi:hypothetical protein